MEISEIKIGGLLSFVQSEKFGQLNPKPITKLRAISQFNNPDSDPEQIALIYVSEGSDLLGFAGLLPRKITNTDIFVFSNTCWWAHPEKGRGLAIPLILKAIERSGSSLYLAESTPQLKAILEKTGKFEFSNRVYGIRGFIRFYFADFISNKYKKWAWVSPIVRFADMILNLATSLIRVYYCRKFKKNNFTVEPIDLIDSDSNEFIGRHAGNDFIQKSAASFNWMRKYPWVKVSDGQLNCKYPFTHEVKNYELQYYVLKWEGKIKGFVAISNRDNLVKIPYIYFNKEDSSRIIQTVLTIILKKKYNSMITFHPEIVEFINANKMPFLFRKKEMKIVGTTKSMYKIFLQNPLIQDGDGDVIFT